MVLRRLDSPSIRGGGAVLEPTDLELMTAARTSNGRSPTADESVVEFVLSTATLASNVHRRVYPPAPARVGTARVGKWPLV